MEKTSSASDPVELLTLFSLIISILLYCLISVKYFVKFSFLLPIHTDDFPNCSDIVVFVQVDIWAFWVEALEVALAEFFDIVSAVYLEDADSIIVNLWGGFDKEVIFVSYLWFHGATDDESDRVIVFGIWYIVQIKRDFKT